MDLLECMDVAVSGLCNCRLCHARGLLMSVPESMKIREIITAAASAEVPEDRPAICGTVTLHCMDGDETLGLSMPMLDALLLLNSLREIEKALALQGWASQIGCSAHAAEDMADELRRVADEMAVPATLLN